MTPVSILHWFQQVEFYKALLLQVACQDSLSRGSNILNRRYPVPSARLSFKPQEIIRDDLVRLICFQDCEVVVVLGAFGGRLDHVMANINTLFEAKKFLNKPVVLFSKESVAFLLKPVRSVLFSSVVWAFKLVFLCRVHLGLESRKVEALSRKETFNHTYRQMLKWKCLKDIHDTSRQLDFNGRAVHSFQTFEVLLVSKQTFLQSILNVFPRPFWGSLILLFVIWCVGLGKEV